MPCTCRRAAVLSLVPRMQDDRADSQEPVPRASHTATEVEIALAAGHVAVADAAAAERAAGESSAAPGPAPPEAKHECVLCTFVCASPRQRLLTASPAEHAADISKVFRNLLAVGCA